MGGIYLPWAIELEILANDTLLPLLLCAVLGPSPTQELGGSASSRRDDSTGRRSAKGSAPGSVSGLANYSHWVSLIPRGIRGITRVIICGVCRKDYSDYRLKFAVQNPSLQFNLWNCTRHYKTIFDIFRF